VQSSEPRSRRDAALDQASQHARRTALLTSQRATSEARTKGDWSDAPGGTEAEGRKADVGRHGSISIMQRSARLSRASSARRWSAKAAMWSERDQSRDIQQLDPIYADSRIGHRIIIISGVRLRAAELDRIGPMRHGNARA